jgi:hypothetical protein
MAFEMTGYIEVADRLRDWYEKHPGGRIVTEVLENNDKRVTVRAEAYRKADDALPAGVGHSALTIPGTTPYTRGSELENAETSAVGRALVMAGLPSKKIASADEVQAKRATPAPQAAPAESWSANDDLVSDAAVALFGDTAVFQEEPMVAAAIRFASGAADGECPTHKVPWTKKPGGVSKTTNKPYEPFYGCSRRDESGWCKQKPKISWIAAQGGGR